MSDQSSDASTESTVNRLTIGWCYAIIFGLSAVGLLYGLYNVLMILRVKVRSTYSGYYHDENNSLQREINDEQAHEVVRIGRIINRGAKAYLRQQSLYLLGFILIMAIIIFFLVELKLGQLWSTAAFVIGAVTSILCGYIGMLISVNANYRTTYAAAKGGVREAFRMAYRSGCVLSFCLVSIELLLLTLIIVVYDAAYPAETCNSYERTSLIFDAIASFGFGGSSVALFCRVGGGIYTKAADVGADLVGKVEKGLEEDSPRNPATIADNVGDNVGDIAGMGADLFGSLAESSCSVLLIAASNPQITELSSILYPLLIIAFSLVACLITAVIGLNIRSGLKNTTGVERNLSLQLLISSLLMTPCIYLASYISLPENLTGFLADGTERAYYYAFYCPILGLYGGLIIGLVTNYYTSFAYRPVRNLAESCKTGAATNVIQGLALGNLSAGIPVVIIGIIAVVGSKMLGPYGVGLGAIGMLSTMPIVLAVDGFGPVSDNAGGIAEMAELPKGVRAATDDLDAAGNTTAAIGKGFAIGSAALVGLALFSAFITRIQVYASTGTTFSCTNDSTYYDYTNLQNIDLNIYNMAVYFGLLIGALLPYLFTAFTMKSVGKAAWEMINEIRRQFRAHPGILDGTEEPNHNRCIEIATKSALREMILPGVLVLGTPLLLGILFGPTIIFGLLPGSLVSGVCQAISYSNTGGAWDNCKKYIEKGMLKVDGVPSKKHSEEHKAAVIGDTVGDPLKDTSGPSLNILIKLMAIFCVVFAPFIARAGYLIDWIQ